MPRSLPCTPAKKLPPKAMSTGTLPKPGTSTIDVLAEQEGRNVDDGVRGPRVRSRPDVRLDRPAGMSI